MSTKKCYILVGPPGVGKSTWTEIGFLGTEHYVVSSDAILEEMAVADGLTYNESFQKYAKVATSMMWEELYKAVSEQWDNIIIDRTNMSVKTRKQIFERTKLSLWILRTRFLRFSTTLHLFLRFVSMGNGVVRVFRRVLLFLKSKRCSSSLLYV